MWRRELRWMQHVVRAQDAEQRLDRWLRRQFPALPQSFLQTQLRKRKIRLQPPEDQAVAVAVAARANSLLLEGSVVAVDAHLFQHKLQPIAEQQQRGAEQYGSPTTAEDQQRLQRLMQRVVYRDDHFLVMNKPHGLAVQDGSALTESLARYLPWIADALRGGCPQQYEEQELRLVHRLDKKTSGVLVLARSRLAAARFSDMLRSGDVHKTYEALVSPPGAASTRDSFSSLKRFEGREVKLPVDGKSACPRYSKITEQIENISIK
ncbi:Pseudouridine synthase [Phytophthora cinnamomi]|uniref:Pseudouridine synthase n=1 Tax=Phytophthora cinnamomi TaxID=4785 RepID=UPI00355A8FB6|nr:Pseudouridine synthase [Phytophthora cinnamomi]